MLHIMASFQIDRAHPPSRIVYRKGAEYLELRPGSLADADGVIQAMNESARELKAFMSWAHHPVDKNTEYHRISSFASDYWAGRQYPLGMFSQTQEILGAIILTPRVAMNPSKALEVGLWVHSHQAGKGLGALGIRVLVHLAFDFFDCDRFYATLDEKNLRSQKLFEKCGFIFEGILRNYVTAASREMLEQGYQGSGNHRIYSITLDDVPNLSWLNEIRANTQVFDAFGACHLKK